MVVGEKERLKRDKIETERKRELDVSCESVYAGMSF